jgi:hypothetical protein
MKKIKDLFDDYNNIPRRIQSILKLENEKIWDCPSYTDLEKMKQKVEKYGYTFDYGLDATAYGLRPIHVKLEEVEGC